MEIYSSIESLKADRPIVTMGIFDGVHTGHAALLKRLVELSKENNRESVLLTFSPHPRIVLNQDADKLQLLTSLDEKIKIISEFGINHLIIEPFTHELASLSAEDFITGYLINKMNIGHLLAGYNHRFGKGGIDFDTLSDISRKHDFGLTQFGRVDIGELHPGSSKIRSLLLSGKIREANVLLGYKYKILGKVTEGSKIGRQLNYPTANISLKEPMKLVPSDGVYACLVKVGGKAYGGMVNIGFRPTVNSKDSNHSIEAHIFDFDKDIYSEEIEICFVDKVREEICFSGMEELKKQLSDDEMVVRDIIVTEKSL